MRYKRRRDIFDLFPVDVIEPCMIFYLLGAVFTQTNLWIAEQTAYQINDFVRYRHLGWKIEKLFVSLDFVVYFIVVISRKRGIAYEHFIDDDPQSPPIDHLCISYPLQHLRRNIIRRSNSTKSQLSIFRCTFAFLQIFLKIIHSRAHNLSRNVLM